MELERRHTQRYKIELALVFKAFVSRRVVHVGHGRTVNISSRGVLFESDIPLEPGVHVEITIHWPARFEDRFPLQFHLVGRVVRQNGRDTAVQMTQASLCRVLGTGNEEETSDNAYVEDLSSAAYRAS